MNTWFQKRAGSFNSRYALLHRNEALVYEIPHPRRFCAVLWAVLSILQHNLLSLLREVLEYECNINYRKLHLSGFWLAGYLLI